MPLGWSFSSPFMVPPAVVQCLVVWTKRGRFCGALRLVGRRNTASVLMQGGGVEELCLAGDILRAEVIIPVLL